MKISISIFYQALFISLLCFADFNPLMAQNNMGIGTDAPHESAILQIKSTTQGLMIPTREVSGPDWTPTTFGGDNGEGMLRYDRNTHQLQSYYSGWKGVSPWVRSGDDIWYPSGGIGIGIAPSLGLLHLKMKGTTYSDGIRMATSLATDEDWYTYMNGNDDYVINNDSNIDALRLSADGEVYTKNYNYITHSSPTLVLQDTDHRSGFLHVNSNLMYFLSGGVNASTWTINGSYWPLTLNMGTDEAILGGDLRVPEGNVGIGTNTLPTVRLTIDCGMERAIELDANSTDYSTLRIDNTATDGVGIWIGEGRALKPGGGDWESTSDIRLKKDVEKYSEGLDAIRKIRTVWYRYNGMEGFDSIPRYVGVIAQELQKIAPYMITKGVEGENPENYLGVNPSSFTYMLINSVQELDKTVQKQQEKIEAQQTELDAIKKALAKAGISLD